MKRMKLLLMKTKRTVSEGGRLSLLSDYRTEIMGLAALGVVLCHACLHCDLPPFLYKILHLGNQCVDIFLFVSGMGIYFSLRKINNGLDNGLGKLFWFKRRFSRIIIPYLIAAIPFYIWFCITNHYGLSRYFYHLSSLSFWVEHEGMWFVDLLMPLYLVSPVMAFFIEKVGKNRWVPTMLLITICFLWSVVSFADDLRGKVAYDVFSNIQYVACRVPMYVLGYFTGKYVMENKRLNGFVLISCMTLVYMVIKLFWGDSAYCGWFWGLIMMSVFCGVIHLIKRAKLRKILIWLGKRSLEIYLANCILVPFLFSFSYKFGSVDLTKGNFFYYFLVIVIGFPLAEVIHCLSDRIRNVACLDLESRK